MKAKIQARINSAPKSMLEAAVPLETPYSIHIDVCSLCNFKCSFCFQSDKEAIRRKGLQRGFMDFTLFQKIADDLTHFKDKFKKVKIGLHGEPTMHPELPAMIRLLKSKNVTDTIELFTNGSFLKPVLNREIIEAGLSRINISVEALDCARYEKVTGYRMDMEGFVANIKDLYDIRGNCRIYIKIVDIDLSADDKQKFYAMFGDICDEIFVENVVPQWTEINKFGMQGTGMYGQKITGYKYVCPFLFMYLHFNYDGTTSGCTLDWGKEVLIGDVSKESALSIWNGDKLRTLQIAHLEKRRGDIPFCSHCLAPMVCCMDDLDACAGEVLEKIKQSRHPRSA